MPDSSGGSPPILANLRATQGDLVVRLADWRKSVHRECSASRDCHELTRWRNSGVLCKNHAAFREPSLPVEARITGRGIQHQHLFSVALFICDTSSQCSNR